MKLELELTTEIEHTIRVQQLESLFEVPTTEKLSVHLNADLPIESKEWNIGLIVGPSGSGKTLSLNKLFGAPLSMSWPSLPVVDAISQDLSISEIVNAFKSVGFNTIPAWMRPFSTLSNGEQFRCELARRMLEDQRPVVTIDEFTSDVDRQVAKIGAFAVAKYARANSRKMVCASCHYDIIDWLEPDWVFEPASSSFFWRLLRGRPKLDCEVTRIQYASWKLFAPYHYMSVELNRAARCFGLFVGNRIAAMCGILYRPHPKVTNIMGFTRMVCLPDWQGMGIALRLASIVGSAYSALGFRLRSYPNHPTWIRSYQKSPDWKQAKGSGTFSPRLWQTSTVRGFGGSRCAVFEYCGEQMDLHQAHDLVGK